jgi:hypothetical protein
MKRKITMFIAAAAPGGWEVLSPAGKKMESGD